MLLSELPPPCNKVGSMCTTFLLCWSSPFPYLFVLHITLKLCSFTVLCYPSFLPLPLWFPLYSVAILFHAGCPRIGISRPLSSSHTAYSKYLYHNAKRKGKESKTWKAYTDKLCCMSEICYTFVWWTTGIGFNWSKIPLVNQSPYGQMVEA